NAEALGVVRNGQRKLLENYLAKIVEQSKGIGRQRYLESLQQGVEERKARTSAAAVVCEQKGDQPLSLYWVDPDGTVRQAPEKPLLPFDGAAKRKMLQWEDPEKEGLIQFGQRDPKERETRDVLLYRGYFPPWNWHLVALVEKSQVAKSINWKKLIGDVSPLPDGAGPIHSRLTDSEGNLLAPPGEKGSHDLSVLSLKNAGLLTKIGEIGEDEVGYSERFWPQGEGTAVAGEGKEGNGETVAPGKPERKRSVKRAVAYARVPGLDAFVLSSADYRAISRPARLAANAAVAVAAVAVVAFFAFVAVLERTRSLHERVRLISSEKAKAIEVRVRETTDDFEKTVADLQGRVARGLQVEKDLRQRNEELASWVEELKQSSREIALLNQMGDLLQACRSVEETYSVILQLAGELFPQDSGALCRFRESENLLETVATWGKSLLTENEFALDDCWALRRGKVHVVEESDSELNCRHLAAPPPHGYICLPMMAQGELLGMLHLQCGPPEAGSKPEDRSALIESKRRLASTVTEQFGLALANLNLREILRIQSIRDRQTGLFNRRYMEECLVREIHRAQRREKPLGVIMLDVDHFKSFNDAYGHEKGDIVLRELGATIQQRVRQEDVACRYGGEEFIILMPDAPLSIAQERAEELREHVKRRLKVEQHPVTISLGVAVYPDHGLTQEALLNAADSALYRAKEQGRDRVVVWQVEE
ncbi:MAG TPA: sensor domain-containing diguanylate cyclase, partial [Sumerlaeia bacterium]|nr:sensor domain-containing diguanylate cyclase [Sumerlaeia bacterium]